MAYLRKTRKSMKPRYKRRIRRVPRNKFSIKSAALPRTMAVRLKYFDQLRLDPQPGIPAVHSFRANSCYDPDFTGIGHQPMAFDQYMALYSRYTVVGSKISITASPQDDTSLNSSALVGVYKSTDPGFPSPISTLIESDKCTYRIIQLSDTSRPISVKYSTKKSQGVKNIMDNIELSGTQTTNPRVEDYFHVFAAGVNSAQDPTRISYQVHISYYVIFSDPRQLQGS